VKNLWLLYLPLSVYLCADIKVYQYTGVDVKHAGKSVTLEREIDPQCLDIPISNDYIWEGSYADEKVPKACKAMFVTSLGQIQPMSIHPEVETYGEMEVLHFFKQMQGKNDGLLVDTRGEAWYEYRTIPSAVNIPHYIISKADMYPNAFHKALKRMGVLEKSGKYDFSQAKEIVLFCNGTWCSQSAGMIKNLLKLGYPPGKLKWYRGGMHDWLSLSMTTTYKREP